MVATGTSTQLGQIAGSIGDAGETTAPILQQMNRFARIIAILILLSSVLIFAIGMALGQPADELFLTLVALMVAAIPNPSG